MQSNQNIKLLFFLIIIVMIIGFINVVISAYSIRTVTNNRSADSIDVGIKLNYALAVFSGISIIIGGVLMYLLNTSSPVVMPLMHVEPKRPQPQQPQPPPPPPPQPQSQQQPSHYPILSRSYQNHNLEPIDEDIPYIGSSSSNRMH